MTWNNFIWFAIPAILLWLFAGVAVWKQTLKKWAVLAMAAGIVLSVVVVAGMWVSLGRPPMRTVGETRLWYALFLSATGLLAYRKFKYEWMLSFAALMSIVFTAINILKPEIHSSALMPALQSIWFVPHVTVYMLSYAMSAAAAVSAVIQLCKLHKNNAVDAGVLDFTDSVVYAATGLLMLGMLMGMVWAEQAWGHYWTWDPKESWALATAAAYMVYIHVRMTRRSVRTSMWILLVALALLMITWLGVDILPAASLHSY